MPDYMVMIATNEKFKLVHDQLGSVRMVVNASTGAVAQRIQYDEFGKVLSDTNPGFQPFGYAGGLYDPDTGLVRFGAREYDPELGRWLSKDPILFDGGDNLFAYAENDPVNRIDIDGRYSFLVTSVIGAFAVYELYNFIKGEPLVSEKIRQYLLERLSPEVRDFLGVEEPESNQANTKTEGVPLRGPASTGPQSGQTEKAPACK